MGGASVESEEPVMDYEEAMKEISVNELATGGRSCWAWSSFDFFPDPIYSKMQKKLLEKHQAEKEGK